MNKGKYPFIIILVIVAAILLGFAYNGVMNAVEKGEYKRDYSDYVTTYSLKFGVPEYVIYAVIKVESDFRPNVTSSAGAAGLMQITSGTFADITGKYMLNENLSYSKVYDPDTNIRYGTYYLSYLYKQFGNWSTVFAAYNAGIGNVSSWLQNKFYSLDGKTLISYPAEFSETKNYVRLANKAVDVYKRLYYI